MHVIDVYMDDEDFDQMCVAGTDDMMRLYHDQPERFENHKKIRDTPPRKPWKNGYWVDGDWAVVVLLRAYLVHLDESFEIFYDTNYPNAWGGWLIMTDFDIPTHRS